MGGAASFIYVVGEVPGNCGVEKEGVLSLPIRCRSRHQVTFHTLRLAPVLRDFIIVKSHLSL